MPKGEHGDECYDRDGGVEQQAVRGEGGVEAAVEEGEDHVDPAAQAEAAPRGDSAPAPSQLAGPSRSVSEMVAEHKPFRLVYLWSSSCKMCLLISIHLVGLRTALP